MKTFLICLVCVLLFVGVMLWVSSLDWRDTAIYLPIRICENDPQIQYYIDGTNNRYDFTCEDGDAKWVLTDGSVITGRVKIAFVEGVKLGVSFHFYFTDATHTAAPMDTCWINYENQHLVTSPTVIDFEKQKQLWEENPDLKGYGPMNNAFITCATTQDAAIQMQASFVPHEALVASPK